MGRWGDGPGPWFTASYPGECARCGDEFDEGEQIRADGSGGYECCEDDGGHTAPTRRDPYGGKTSVDDMGY